MEGKLIIRPPKMDDLDEVVEIDRKVLGKVRRDYWKDKFELIFNKGGHFSLVAEVDGKVVGFILGFVSGWEFKVPESTGWLDVIGVDPSYQRKGIGTRLFKGLMEEMKKNGVKRVFTLVNWEDWDLMAFFRKMGFKRGEMINLSLEL